MRSFGISSFRGDLLFERNDSAQTRTTQARPSLPGYPELHRRTECDGYLENGYREAL